MRSQTVHLQHMRLSIQNQRIAALLREIDARHTQQQHQAPASAPAAAAAERQQRDRRQDGKSFADCLYRAMLWRGLDKHEKIHGCFRYFKQYPGLPHKEVHMRLVEGLREGFVARCWEEARQQLDEAERAAGLGPAQQPQQQLEEEESAPLKTAAGARVWLALRGAGGLGSLVLTSEHDRAVFELFTAFLRAGAEHVWSVALRKERRLVAPGAATAWPPCLVGTKGWRSSSAPSLPRQCTRKGASGGRKVTRALRPRRRQHRLLPPLRLLVEKGRRCSGRRH